MENTIDTLRFRLQAHKWKWPNLARVSGVPVSTIRKVANGHVKNPRINTVDKLHRGLDELAPTRTPQ